MNLTAFLTGKRPLRHASLSFSPSLSAVQTVLGCATCVPLVVFPTCSHLRAFSFSFRCLKKVIGSWFLVLRWMVV